MNPQPVRSAARAFNPGTYPPGGGFGVEIGVGVGPPGAARERRPIIRIAVVAHRGSAEVAVSGLSPPRHPPFVGRDCEVATIAAHLDAARAGAGSVVLLADEPGIGTSRLLAELAD
jgi:hypothetical protein